MINDFITLGNIKIDTFSIFIVASILFATYVIWKEAKKEGFEEDHIFDMLVGVLLAFVFVGRFSYALTNYRSLVEVFIHTVSFWTFGIDILGGICGGIAILYTWIKLRKWSLFRIMDIFAMGATIGIAILGLGFTFTRLDFRYLILFGFFLALHAGLIYLRRIGVTFGVLFGMFLTGLGVALGVLSFDKKGSLVFYGVLFVVGLAVIFKRLEGKKKTMQKGISQDFLTKMKSALTKKDVELEKEERLLTKEEMYTKPGRDAGSSENEDGAVLDENREINSVLKNSIMEMRLQIRRALAKINIGTYGICEVCHRPIDPARMKAFPQATLCSEDADRQENK